MSTRAGHSLPELLVALVLTGLVCSVLIGTFSAAQSVARSHAWMVRTREAIRVAGAVLGDELRTLDPRVDLRTVSEDSVAIRAYRGIGIACDVAMDGVAWVRYRGLRSPEPEKDSVLIVDSIGGARPVPLLDSEPLDDACGAHEGETRYRWSLPETPPAGTLLLVFESGSYHLTDRALRYRRGDGGRQPLTAELLDVRRSTFATASAGGPMAGAPGTLAIESTFAVRADARHGAGPVRARTARFRFPLLNARAGGARP